MALLVYYDNGVEYSYVVGPEPVVVGRANECAIRTADGLVSRNHARFFLDQSGALYVEDLGSSNGVFVGNRRVQQSPVGLNEVVTIGGLTFRLASYGALAPQAPPPNASWQAIDTQPVVPRPGEQAAYGATAAYQPYGDPYAQNPAVNAQYPGAPYQQPGAAPYQQPGAAPHQQPGAAPYQQTGAAPYQPGAAPYQQPGAAPYQQPGGAPYQPQPAPYQSPTAQPPAASQPQGAQADASSSVQIDWNADVDAERKARLAAEANADVERSGRLAAQAERDAADAKLVELNETIRRLVEDLAATKMELEAARAELGRLQSQKK